MSTVLLFSMFATALPSAYASNASENPIEIDGNIIEPVVTSVSEIYNSFFEGNKKVVIDDSNFEELLFAGNSDIIHATSAVIKAKDQMRATRAGLLPSLNLNLGLLLSNTPMFLANSVTCLVPFIFPSRWFDLKASNRSFDAEIMAMHIAKLNVYAAAYSVVVHVQGDEQTAKLANDQRERLASYVKDLEVLSNLGIGQRVDVLRAKSDLGRMEIEVSKVKQLVAEERAIIRKMFGLPITADFEMHVGQAGKSKLENMPIDQGLKLASSVAPEKDQINLLISSSKYALKSAQWAFLSGCSGNQGGVSTGQGGLLQAGSFSFSTMVGVSVGFGFFPALKLARRNIKDMEYRLTELDLELARQIETALAGVEEVKVRHEQAEVNRLNAMELLDQTKELYKLGRADVKQVLEAYQSASGAEMEKISSDIAMSGHRVTLMRAALEGKFKTILDASKKDAEETYRKGRSWWKFWKKG